MGRGVLLRAPLQFGNRIDGLLDLLRVCRHADLMPSASLVTPSSSRAAGIVAVARQARDDIRMVSPFERHESERWRELFAAYNRFYEVELDEAIYAATWQRIVDPAG